jgi:gliding motility-associated-like protein
MTTNFTINNTSTPVSVSYFWDFGDGTTSTVRSPVKSYALPGVYQIKLVNNFGACSDSLIKNITVLPKPVSAFTADPLGSCQAPLTVNFANTSTGAVSYVWNFGDGVTSTLPNPTHTYNNAGAYTVRLTSTGINGCSHSLTRTAYIRIQLPVVTINNLPQEGCAPLSWTFSSTTTSSEPVTSYQWDFGDGGTSTLANPTHIFNEGVYNIQLIITTASGCRDTVIVPQGIKAGIRPAANFSATPRDMCAETAAVFTDLSTGTVTHWIWDFGDGGTSTVQNPTHTYNDTGYFAVTLIAINNGCRDTIVFPDYVHIKPPVARFIVTSTCIEPYKRNFSDRSVGAEEWAWDFGDGNTSSVQNPVHVYAAPGIYVVTLVVRNLTYGCEDTWTVDVRIVDEPATFAAADSVVCRSTPVNFSAVGSNPLNIVSYQWSFGDASTGTGRTVSHSYPQAGFYTVSLIITDVNGCKDTLVKPQYIRVNGPTANFGSSVPGTCLLNTIGLVDSSQNDGINPIVQWIWNYGDGIIDTLSSGPFQHTYALPGIYTVTLTVTDSTGCSNTIIKTNLLTISKPVANFNTIDTSTCPNRSVTFNNTSTGPGLTYLWNFGDGNTSTDQNPVHNYLADGNYSVKLVIVDQFGCTDSITRTSYISIRTPLANYTVSDSVGTCPPLVVAFTNTSLNYTSINWDFGDGSSSQSASPSHFYSVPGTYISKLTVTGPGGCTSEKERTIVVRGPSGSFTYGGLSGCTPLTVNFIATSRDRISFIWDFNDGNTLSTTDSVVSHTYTTTGEFIPKMILRDASGCLVPITGPDTIRTRGVTAGFYFNTQPMCNSGNVTFNNITSSNDAISSYLWDFGDGNTSTQDNPSHFYNAPGLYYPKLIAGTLAGCTDSLTSTLPVKIVASPQALIAQTANGCTPISVTFNGSLAVADTSALTWNWDFGNTHTSPLKDPLPEMYTIAGTYPVRLLVTNSSGCMDTVLSNVEAYAIPVVNAGIDTLICQGRGIILNATGGSLYVWTPSLGLSCTDCPNPIATPASETEYFVSGTTNHGCSNIDSVTVKVKYPFSMSNAPGDTLCVGSSYRLSASGAYSYQWSPATGLSSTTAANPVASPQITTSYRVIGTDDRNCFTDTAYIPMVVYNIPTVEAGSDKTMNVGQTIDLIPTISPDVTDVLWSPTGSVFRNIWPGITVKPRETTVYTVEVSNRGGCTATDNLVVSVICNGANIFIPNTFSPNGDGANDIFYPRGSGVFSIKSERIFSRWGEIVFEKHNFNANDISAAWDGTYKGQKLNPDVYVYVIEVLCDNNSLLTYKGNVALIK